MKDAGSALMGIGRASGESRAREAAKEAIASPLLEVNISGAQGVLFNITGGTSLSLFEVDEAAEIIRATADPEANIIFGTVIDERMGDEIAITVIATGFDSSRKREPARQATGAGRGGQRAARRARARGRARDGARGATADGNPCRRRRATDCRLPQSSSLAAGSAELRAARSTRSRTSTSRRSCAGTASKWRSATRSRVSTGARSSGRRPTAEIVHLHRRSGASRNRGAANSSRDRPRSD